MSVASRPVSTGKTRTCPHCKATILESLSICPGCMHHLRFDSEAAKRQVAAAPALRVEGIIRHPPNEQPLEYFVIIAIRNDRGEEVTRQVVNVGALQASEKRTFTMSVEVLPPSAPMPPQGKTNASTGTFKAPPAAPQLPTLPPPPSATVRPSPPATPPASSGSTASSSTSGSSGASSVSPSAGSATPPGASTQSRPAAPGAPSTSARPPTMPSGPNRSGTSQGAPKPGAPKPGAPNTPRAPTPSSAGSPSPANPGGQPGAANPANPANPASPATPQSGYVLKPPSPGGPKRH
jgi:hypothetical protein